MKNQIYTLLIVAFFGVLIYFAHEHNKKHKEVIEEVRFNINGVKHGVVFKYTNPHNPIVLFVHGGPGFTLTPYSHSFDAQFIKKFTVVHWDQRGTGLSYMPELNEKNLNIPILVDDGLKITNAVLAKMKQDRLILVAHSFGTILADRMIAMTPEKYSAYIPVSKMTNYNESEKRRYDFVVKGVQASGDNELRLVLDSLGAPPFNTYKLMMRLSYLTFQLQGSWTNKTAKQLSEIFKASPLYTDWEKDKMYNENHRSFELLVSSIRNYEAVDWVAPRMPIYMGIWSRK